MCNVSRETPARRVPGGNVEVFKMRWYDFIKTFTCIKSIVTLALTGCYIYLCVIGKINAESFMNIYIMVIGFYFGTQWQKRNDTETEVKKNVTK